MSGQLCAEISLMPTRVLLNGALLPSQCWYLMFDRTFVYLGKCKITGTAVTSVSTLCNAIFKIDKASRAWNFYPI